MALLSSQLAIFSGTVFASLLQQGRYQIGTALVLADQGTPSLFGQGAAHQLAVLDFPGDLRSGLQFQLIAELFWYRNLSLC